LVEFTLSLNSHSTPSANRRTLGAAARQDG
jgi:hypothetical protein